MINTIFKTALLAAGAFAVYRIVNGKPVIPGNLLGYKKHTALVNRNHPRTSGCCGQQQVTYDIWEPSESGKNRHITPPDTFSYANHTTAYDFRAV
jgi:hypothetical protein